MHPPTYGGDYGKTIETDFWTGVEALFYPGWGKVGIVEPLDFLHYQPQETQLKIMLSDFNASAFLGGIYIFRYLIKYHEWYS